MVATEAAYESFKDLESVVVWITNVSYMPRIVQTQFLFDSAVGRDYRGAVLMEEVFQWGWALSGERPHSTSSSLSASWDISALCSWIDACHFLLCFLVMLGSHPSGGKLK